MRISQIINEEVDSKAEIYVDMDGVLADFFGVWTKMVGVKNWKEVKDVDSALDMIRTQKDFWINLPLTPNASKLLNSIKKVKGNYTILSSPLPDDPNSEPQKREWVKKMLSGFSPKRVIITHNKSAYAKQPDGTPNVLIDDYGDNINKWESAGGIGIQHSDKNADATVKRLEEGDFVHAISRFMNRSIRPGMYKRAAAKFHEWLKDQAPYRHSLGYYAMEWGNQYKNMDWRNLKQAYEVMFGDDVLVESTENDKMSARRNITTKTTVNDQGRSSEKVNTSNIRNTNNTGTTDLFKRSVKTINPDNTTSKQSSKTLVRPDNTFTTTDSKGNKTKGYDSIFKHRPQSLKMPTSEAKTDQSLIQSIKNKAVELGVDPAVLLAIAWKESRIRPGLIGDKKMKNKAHGVFQVRKPALTDVNQFYKTKFTVDDMKNDIDKNIEVGALYLKMMKDRYGAKDLPSQIAGYNGGPNALKGKIDQANDYATDVLSYSNNIADVIGADDSSQPAVSSKNIPTNFPSPRKRPDNLIPTPPPSPRMRPDDLVPMPTPTPSPRRRPDDLVPMPSPRRRPDNLVSPARITYVDLAKSNGIKDPNRISIGQPIQLPNGNNYIVKSGDTLSNIAQAFNIMQPMSEGNQPKLVKDKKLKNLKIMNKPTKHEKRKNYQQADENFADGKNPERKGLSKRVGIPQGATLAQLEKIAKNSTGEKRRMAQWQLNMRRGKAKKNK